METIARELGVTRSAVSRALSGRKGVSEVTRQRVVAAARRHGYAARQAPAPEPAQVVLLVEERTMREPDFWSHVLNGVAAEVPLHNGILSIAVTDERSPRFSLPPVLQQVGRVNGVVAAHATDPRAVNAVRRLGIPIVLLDYLAERSEFDSVVIDDHGGAALVASELLKMGHRSFGFVGDLEIASFRSRYEGLVCALVRAGAMERVPACWPSPESLPGLDGLPTAILCCNDSWAVRTVDHLLARGIRVPEDVSVAGFDDGPCAATCRAPLSTLRVDREELGRWGARALFQRLNNPGGPPIRVAVGVSLVRRESLGEPRREGAQ